MVTVELDNRALAQAVGAYIVKHKLLKHGETSKNNLRIERVDSRQEDGSRLILTLGVGQFEFEEDGNAFQFVRKRMGDPVTARTNEYESVVHEIVRIIGPTKEIVHDLCSRSMESADADIFDHFQVYKYSAGNEFWQRIAYVPIRPMDTIVLDAEVSKAVLTDLNEFVSPETREWYKKHCIPLRRGYLLHGPPGTGKSSMIAAIASYLERGVHRISLVAPRMTDDALCMAISQVHHPGIIVFEDIDALFDGHRARKDDFSVTFSGLLNAIDGVGDKHTGSLFIFTSNHPERLDNALTRKGRIDRRFAFGRVNADMARRMFLRFYPGEDAAALLFPKNVAARLGPDW